MQSLTDSFVILSLGFFSLVQDALVYEVVNGPHPYFYLNPVTGNITLIKDLATTPDKTFTVSFSPSSHPHRHLQYFFYHQQRCVQ
jgi:hypothetical protein